MVVESLEGPGKVVGRERFEEDGKRRNGFDEGAAVRVGVEFAGRGGFGGVGGFGREELGKGFVEGFDVRRDGVVRVGVMAFEKDGRRVGKGKEVPKPKSSDLFAALQDCQFRF